MSALELELTAALSASSALETTLALCRAWAVTPSTRIAALARGFDRQLHRASVPGANEAQREAAWLELAERGSPADLGALLATPWSKRPRLASQRLEHFRQRGPDPRVVGHLLELDTGLRFASTAGRSFWLDAYELMLEWGSVEAAQRIRREPSIGTAQSLTEAVRERALYLPLALRRAGRWPTEPELPDRAVTLLGQLERRLAPSLHVATELLAAVQASPADDAPRLVLADALTEQGDPRGEFIALQFAHVRGELTMGKREQMQRVLAASGRAWFDGLEAQIEPLAIFQKGFLHEVSLATRTPDPSLRAWSTVEVIHVAGVAASLSSFLAHPHLAQVHTLRAVRGGTLEELARAGAAHAFQLIELSHLGARGLATPAWTLRSLRLLTPVDESVWWLAGSVLKDRIEELALTLRGASERLGPVVAELEALKSSARVLEFGSQPPWWTKVWHGDWRLRFTRDARGRFSALEVSLGDEHLAGLSDALASLDRDQLKSLKVTVLLKRGPSWRASTQAMIEQALAGQRRLTSAEFELETPISLPPRPTLTTGS